MPGSMVAFAPIEAPRLTVRAREFRRVHLAARKPVVGEGGVRTDEHVVLERDPIPELHAAFDRDAVMHHHVVLDKDVVADVAVPADAGALENVRESPNAGARPYLDALADGIGVDERFLPGALASGLTHQLDSPRTGFWHLGLPRSGETPRRPNNRQGAPLGVLVGAPSVSADNTETKHIQGAEEHDYHHRRRITRNVNRPGKAHDNDHKPEDDSAQCPEQTRQRKADNGQIGEGKNTVQQIGDLLAERPGAFARSPPTAVVADFSFAEAEPIELAEHRGMELIQLQKFVSHLFVAGEDVDSARRQVRNDETPVGPPEQLGG